MHVSEAISWQNVRWMFIVSMNCLNRSDLVFSWIRPQFSVWIQCWFPVWIQLHVIQEQISASDLRIRQKWQYNSNIAQIATNSNTSTCKLNVIRVVGFDGVEQMLSVVVVVKVFDYVPLVMSVKICVDRLSCTFIQQRHPKTVKSTSFGEMLYDQVHFWRNG